MEELCNSGAYRGFEYAVLRSVRLNVVNSRDSYASTKSPMKYHTHEA